MWGKTIIVAIPFIDKPLDSLSVGDIPWVFRYPQLQLYEWQIKIKSVVDYYQSQAIRAERELGKVDLPTATRHRLKVLAECYALSSKEYEKILSYLALTNSSGPNQTEFTKLFFNKTPRQQTVRAYHETFFRDWVWGKDELEKQCTLLAPLMKNTRRLLTLGAGACGLPLAIHKNLNLAQTLSVDINPVLMLQAKRLLCGETLNVVEYPQIPRESQFVAKKHQIAHTQKYDNFHMLFADGQNLETPAGTFDTILTPWFIDIIPRNFSDLAKHLNHNLSRGDKWLNIGLLAFEKNELSEKLTPNEVRETLELAGFGIEKFELQDIPYLQSPYSAISRTDCVLIFSAIKEKNCKKPGRFEYLPSWLQDLDEPLPNNSEIQNLKSKSQTFSKVLHLVDGQKSFSKISEVFAQENNFDVNSTKEALHVFFVNIYEHLIFREF